VSCAPSTECHGCEINITIASAQPEKYANRNTRPMSKRVVHAIAGSLVLAGASMMASATSIWPSDLDLGDASMQVTIGGQAFNDITLNWVASTDPITGKQGFTLSGPPIVLETADGSSLTIGGATFEPDPVLIFSANATNNGNNPLAFSFAFNTPMSPGLLGNITSHAELGVTLTDGNSNGATVQPVSGTMLHPFDIDMNGTPISKNVDVGAAFGFPVNGGVGGSSTGVNVFTADGSLVCNQACVTMSALLSFTLTGHDSVGFSGKVTQD